jgi:nitroreductase
MTNDLMKIIKERRSVRLYDLKQDVPADLVQQILEAAIWAPNAGNVQPWHFFITRDRTLKGQIVRAAYGQSFIAEAPVVIIVCANLEEASFSYGSRGAELYCIQDTAAAVQNMLLMAHSLGIAGCWIGAFDEKSVARIIASTRTLRPVAVVPLGYPAEFPKPPVRKQLDTVITTL